MIVKTIENLQYLTYAPKTQEAFDKAISELKTAGYLPLRQYPPFQTETQVYIAYSPVNSGGAPVYVVGINNGADDRTNKDQNVEDLKDFVDTVEHLYLEGLNGDQSLASLGKQVAPILFGSEGTGLSSEIIKGILGAGR